MVHVARQGKEAVVREVVDPERIRKRLVGATPRERAAIRSEEVKASVLDIVPGTRIRRGDIEIVFDTAPSLVTHRARGDVVGVEVFVRVFRAGVELDIDNHRRCLPAPTMVPDGTTHTEVDDFGREYEVDNFKEDPREAYLTWLEQSIRTVPR